MKLKKNINELSNKEDSLKLNRANLNKNLKDVREQIKYWQDMDVSQTRIF